MPRPNEPCGVPPFLALVALGGNLGDVPATLASAARAMDELPFTYVVGRSSLYLTRPVQAEGPDFYNAVLALRSALAPGELLRALLRLEAQHDRQRPFPHAPRTLDLDLLWFGGACRQSTALQLPHPRLGERAFVLEPLAEVLGQLPDSVAGQPALPPLPDAEFRRNLAHAQGISLAGPFLSVS